MLVINANGNDLRFERYLEFEGCRRTKPMVYANFLAMTAWLILYFDDKSCLREVFFFLQPYFQFHYPLLSDAIATQLVRPWGAHFLEYKSMRYVLSVSGSYLHLLLHSVPWGDVRFVFSVFFSRQQPCQTPTLMSAFFFISLLPSEHPDSSKA